MQPGDFFDVNDLHRSSTTRWTVSLVSSRSASSSGRAILAQVIAGSVTLGQLQAGQAELVVAGHLAALEIAVVGEGRKQAEGRAGIELDALGDFAQGTRLTIRQQGENPEGAVQDANVVARDSPAQPGQPLCSCDHFIDLHSAAGIQRLQFWG